jgi:hypothetical protein
MRDEGAFEIDVMFLLEERKSLDIVLISEGFGVWSIGGFPLQIREKAQSDLVPEIARFRC